jgi:hypothetical protein
VLFAELQVSTVLDFNKYRKSLLPHSPSGTVVAFVFRNNADANTEHHHRLARRDLP